MVRRFAVLTALIAVGVSCTGSTDSPSVRPTSPRSSTSSPPQASTDPNAIKLDVVADTTGPQREGDRPYLDGMRLAIDEVNAAGGVRGRSLALEVHDDGGSPKNGTRLMKALLGNPSPALLYVGEGPALSALRTRFERRRKTLFLLQGDLYTAHAMFREVFQTTIPWEWQAGVIARYLVRDRRARSIGFVGSGKEAGEAEVTTQRALNYWGGHLAWGVTYGSGKEPPTSAVTRAQGADAVVVFGSPPDSARLARLLAESENPPRIVGGASLLVADPGLPPGTTACYPYTWAGWAEPIRRVRLFLGRFRAAFNHDPTGLEQEGYDAVKLLAESLARTGGAGGRKLTNALEKVNDRTFSSFPIELGPDDHVLPPRDELGLFAIAGPNERVDPWQAPGSDPWRALMRTFTYDGNRTSVLDTDRRVFFPFWRKNQPGPEFYRSRYGIRTRARRDPLH
ncbi:MAG TPA: ABC transporter substrate-binding protein [Actinomycetota bacterium]